MWFFKILFQFILFRKEFLQCIEYFSGYLPKLNSGLEPVSRARFLHIFL